jgi:hypothetical protein
MSATQREREYCDAVFNLLLSVAERSMDLATLGRHISKPSKKATARNILAADPRFIVTGTVVVLAAASQEHCDNSEEHVSKLSTSHPSPSPTGQLPPSEEHAYRAKLKAARRLPSCTLPSPQLLREWPHACIGPGACPPLFPGPPLWLSDLPALSAVLPSRARAGLKFAAQTYDRQAQDDEAYLSLRNHSCETCNAPGCLPRCICGEAYCSRQCQLTDWNKNHREACELVRTQSYFVGLLYTALYWKHQHGVTVSDGAFGMCGGDLVDAVEEKAFKPMPSAAHAGGSVRPALQQQQQQQPSTSPASRLSLPSLSPPTHPPSLYHGAVVRVVGLKSRADLNGCMGTVLGEMDSCSQRWPVSVMKEAGQGSEDVKVLAANLTIVTDADAFHGDDAAGLRTGCGVRIRGLAAKPELNGRTGVCGAFNEDSGRWMVVMDEEGSNPPCQVAVRACNLLSTTPASSAVDDAARAADLAARIPAVLRSNFSAVQSLNVLVGREVAQTNVDTDWDEVLKKVRVSVWI